MEYRGVARAQYWFRALVFTALSQFLAGCNHVPSQDILGSFFPSWMLCAAGGILVTVTVRQIAIKTGIQLVRFGEADPLSGIGDFADVRLLACWVR